jgi:hypothetical protein
MYFEGTLVPWQTYRGLLSPCSAPPTSRSPCTDMLRMGSHGLDAAGNSHSFSSPNPSCFLPTLQQAGRQKKAFSIFPSSLAATCKGSSTRPHSVPVTGVEVEVRHWLSCSDSSNKPGRRNVVFPGIAVGLLYPSVPKSKSLQSSVPSV